MAIRVRAQLRKWFGRGMYPTAEQFSDLFDSFFHKTEDKIPMSGVEGLTDQLNGKYSTAEGRELEKRVQKVTTDLSAHVASSEKAFNEVQNDIETLDRKIDDEAQKHEQGDAATLRAANEHTDAAVAEEASARESGDRATLQSAKDYVDKAIAELVDGSPAALDTLKELSAALGNDPNFATTVATQIGQKVDKVAGKGLSTEDYTSEEKAKLAGVAAGANNYQHPATHPASVIVQDSTHRFVTDTEKTTWNGKASTAVATQSANGLMSAADKKKLDGITDDILSLPGEGYEEVEIVDQVSMSASGVMVKVVPGFVLFIIKSVQFGGLKTAKFTLPGFIIGSVLTPAAFRAPGGTCTTIYISTATDKTNKCSNIMFSGVDNAGEVTAPLTFAIQATSFSRE